MKFAVALVCLTFAPPPASADLFEPFSTSNLNPFVQVNGLPTTRSAQLVADGQLSWQLQTEFANNFTDSADTREAITIDGETHRFTLSLRYGVTDRWEVGVEIPFVKHTGGSLDSFIEDWHKIWGLPNSGRGEVQNDQLAYLYQPQGLSPIGVQKSASGMGDVQLNFAYKLSESDNRQWSIRGGVKLPTGDPDDMTGSDSTDTYVSLHLTDPGLLQHPDWYFHSNIGVLALGNGDLLEDQLEDWAVFGSTTLAWNGWKNVSLKAQLDYHSPLYDSNLKELGDFSAQLIVGGSIKIRNRLLLDISLSEDIITDNSPDVVFQIGIRGSF